jgi:hypothetical protein
MVVAKMRIINIDNVRNETRSSIERNKTLEIEHINQLIVDAAGCGEWCCNACKLFPETIKSLKIAGYHVQKTGYGYTIRWS